MPHDVLIAAFRPSYLPTMMYYPTRICRLPSSFISKSPKFVPNPSAPLKSEFERLAKQEGWDLKDLKKKKGKENGNKSGKKSTEDEKKKEREKAAAEERRRATIRWYRRRFFDEATLREFNKHFDGDELSLQARRNLCVRTTVAKKEDVGKLSTIDECKKVRASPPCRSWVWETGD